MKWDSSICRVCLKSEEACVDLCLKVEFLNEFTYLDLFNSSTRLDASLSDELPKSICTRCSNDLITSFQFINQAHSSNELLRKSIESEQIYQYNFKIDNENHGTEEEIETETTVLDAGEDLCYDEIFESQDRDSYLKSPEKQHFFEVVECKSSLYDISNGYEETPHNAMALELEVECLTAEESTKQVSSKLKPDSDGHKTVECNICGKILKRWSIKHHFKRCHKKEKLHLCSACPKTFTTPSDLKIHMKTHDKFRERSFVCTICRKGFFEKQSLGVHMLRHTGVREYQCDICHKKFTTKKSLEVHEFTHNRQNGRFVCKYCNKRFPSRADLTVHERFHTGDYPYKCDLCDKSYAVKSHYNYHMAKHKGVTYKCDQCDKEFMNRGSLTAHKFKHSDKMPHECPVCKKGFTSPFKLNRHQNCHKTNQESLSK